MPKLFIASVNPVNKLFITKLSFTHYQQLSFLNYFNFYLSQFFPVILNNLSHNFSKLIYSVKSELINIFHTTYIKNYIY